MSYEYDAAYRLGLQATADLNRELERRRRIAERTAPEPTAVRTSAPASTWFRNMFGRTPAHRPAPLH